MAANAATAASNPRLQPEEENTIISFDEKDVQFGIERCTRSLVGRLLADKPFSSGTVEAAMYSIWRQPEGFKVVDHGGNIFQFFFGDEKDMLCIERGAPWLFKNYILNLRRWKEGENNAKIYFTHVPIWIQIWGLAEQFKTKELGRKIGGSFGEVLDVDIFHVRGKEHSIVKIQVNLDVTKPLRRYVKLAGPKNQQLEVALKYERIGTFCNYCGFVGHETIACSFQIEDSLKGEVEEEKWRDWLKADQTGRKEGAIKDNPNTNLSKEEDSPKPY